ncbi:MAG: DUF1343 domain-containing protein [Pirellulaceae bacterium]
MIYKTWNRVYTFAWTMVNCLQAYAERGVSVVVLDRPNPLGGEILEGPPLHSAFRSFVGLLDIPMRHGLTLGEIARLAIRELHIDVDLHIMLLRLATQRTVHSHSSAMADAFAQYAFV